MTTEELLKPRYKVIADWPGSLFRIGDLFHSIEGPAEVWESQRSGNKFLYNPSNFPALFKRLEWWEERQPEDMPKYVRFYEPLPLCYSIKKITKWEIGKEMCIVTTNVDIVRKQLSRADQPATEDDFKTFINSQK